MGIGSSNIRIPVIIMMRLFLPAEAVATATNVNAAKRKPEMMWISW